MSLGRMVCVTSDGPAIAQCARTARATAATQPSSDRAVLPAHSAIQSNADASSDSPAVSAPPSATPANTSSVLDNVPTLHLASSPPRAISTSAAASAAANFGTVPVKTDPRAFDSRQRASDTPRSSTAALDTSSLESIARDMSRSSATEPAGPASASDGPSTLSFRFASASRAETTAPTTATRTVALPSAAAIRASSVSTVLPIARVHSDRAMDARHSTPNSRRSSCLCPAQFFAMDGISSAPVLVPPIATPIDPHVSAIACLCVPLGRFTHANICASAAARSIGRRARVAHRE